jgi:hypothetical protein
MCWLFENREDLPRTEDSVAPGISNLPNDAMFLQTINRTLNSGKGQLEMIGSSGYGQEGVCRQEFQDSQGSIGRMASERGSPFGHQIIDAGCTIQNIL